MRWHAYFGAEQHLQGRDQRASKSPVKSLDFVTLRVKDAIVDQFREAMGKRPSVESRKPDVRVHAFLDDKWCTLYVDTSGEPLFKRGKRDHVGEAPLKKNLAAGILRIAGWKPGMPLLDPMCGAGTFLSRSRGDDVRRGAGARARVRLREAHATSTRRTGSAMRAATRAGRECPSRRCRSTAPTSTAARSATRAMQPARRGPRATRCRSSR